MVDWSARSSTLISGTLATFVWTILTNHHGAYSVGTLAYYIGQDILGLNLSE